MLILAALACGPAPPPAPKSAAELRGAYAGTNVLVTLIDAAAAGHLASYGYERETTPFLDELAAESVRFADVTASAPYTLASVASLFTGEHSDVHRVLEAGDALPPGLPLLAERFARAGYATHAVSTNAHVHGRFGFDRGFETFVHVWPQLAAGAPHAVPPEALEALRAFLAASRAAPFFAYWHVMPPHAPYAPPPPHAEAFAAHVRDLSVGSIPHLTPLARGAYVPSADERRAIVDLYDSSLHYVDSVLRDVRGWLESEDLLDETIWIVTSDHGEAFGEHGVYQHAGTVYEEMVRVPLLIRLPGAHLGGTTIAAPAALVDLVPTLVELCDLGAPATLSGVSLVPALAGEQLTRRMPIVTRTAGPGPLTAIRLGDLKLIHGAQTGGLALYDLAADPHERRNLRASRQTDARELYEWLDLWWKRVRTRRDPANRVEVPREIEERLHELGYGGDDEDEDG